MSARTRSSHGTSDLSHPNARPLRQAIILVPCEEHGDHVIMLSGWKAEEVDSCADFIASSMAAAGHTATVTPALPIYSRTSRRVLTRVTGRSTDRATKGRNCPSNPQVIPRLCTGPAPLVDEVPALPFPQPYYRWDSPVESPGTTGM